MDKRLKRCVFINGKEQNRYTHKTRNETLKALGLSKRRPVTHKAGGGQWRWWRGFERETMIRVHPTAPHLPPATLNDFMSEAAAANKSGGGGGRAKWGCATEGGRSGRGGHNDVTPLGPPLAHAKEAGRKTQWRRGGGVAVSSERGSVHVFRVR